MSNKSDTESIDCLTSKLIIMALPCVLPVTHIFNISLSNVIYPEIWKTAIICLSNAKVKHPSHLSNHRPISILCSISKAFERIAADQIKYLEDNDLFDPCQAYRRGFSANDINQSNGR